MKFSGDISITRDSRDMINIRIKDGLSRTQFVDVYMAPEDFAFLITGQSNMPIVGQVFGLDQVGKERIREPRSTQLPNEFKYSKREEIKEWLVANCQEEGWILDTYLGSQTSFSSKGGETTVNYGVFKYVDVSSGGSE